MNMFKNIDKNKKHRMLPPSLLLCVNVSIGSKKKHLSAEKLVSLFDKKVHEYDVFDKYAVKMIQTEATPKSIVSFMQKYKISKEKVKYVLNTVPIY